MQGFTLTAINAAETLTLHKILTKSVECEMLVKDTRSCCLLDEYVSRRNKVHI